MLLPESGSKKESAGWLGVAVAVSVLSTQQVLCLGNGPNVLRRHGNGKMSQEAPKIVANICSFMLP